MKIRTSFVSNSSSSSYVCDISGEAFEVNDGCFWDVGLCHCQNGHIFQKQFLVPWTPTFPSREEMWARLDEITDSKRECLRYREMSLSELQMKYAKAFLGGGGGYETNVNECPICTMTRIKDSELLDYLLKFSGENREEVISHIKESFDNYPAFKRYITTK